ncbi:hypothetical protein GLA29479_1014 [Lysobacter antibioticus]|nr:hypothetical protein GLA29479_1014 [Lysobacter antibioticus]
MTDRTTGAIAGAPAIVDRIHFAHERLPGSSLDPHAPAFVA